MLLVSLALAEPRRTAIALVTGGADPELHARLRAEIVALGWRVTEIAPGGDVALAQVARRARTLAVLRVGKKAEGIELWVAPEVDAQARSEWIDVDDKRPELGVLRAVEALRARFLELGIEPEESANSSAASSASASPSASASATAPAKPTKPPSKPVDGKNETKPNDASTPAPEAPRPVDTLTPDDPNYVRARDLASAFGFGVAGGLIQQTSSGGLAAGVAPTIRVRPDSRYSVGLEAWIPVTAAKLEVAGAYVEMRPTLVGLSGEYRGRTGPLALGAGIGYALAIVAIDGHSSVATFRAQKSTPFVGVPFGRILCEYRLSRQFQLRLDATAAFSAPLLSVKLGDVSKVAWGRPLLAGSLGFEWAPFVN